MLRIRRSNERGHADHGWLDTHHTFSFAGYFDPAHMGYGPLRVINEDTIAPGGGFGAHPHSDMEIITVVVEGGLQHKDSLGSGSVIRPGDVQVMSAGTGIVHAEFNASKTEPVHLLQIWIEPRTSGGDPTYSERRFPEEAQRGRLAPLVSGDGREGSLTIGQDAVLYRARLEAGEAAHAPLEDGRAAWIQVIGGAIDVEGERLSAGDGAALEAVSALEIKAAAGGTDVLVFDLAQPS